MKITISLALSLVTAASGLAFSSAALAAPAPIIIKFSHSSAPDTAKGQAADMFKKLAEQVTKGRVKVEVYPNLQLYQDKDEIAALQKGDVQMLAPALPRLSQMGDTEFEVFYLPYLFPNKDVAHRVMDGKIGKDLFQRLNAKGITGLAFWDDGYMNMSGNRPMLAPADFKGMKIRVPTSDTLSAEVRALGAVPKTYALVESYDAIKSGAVDGTASPLSMIYKWKMNQVQSNLTISRHAFHSYAVLVNKKFWDGLPSDIRTSLDKVMDEVTAYERVAAQLENDQALSAMRATGKTEVYVLSTNEEAIWRQTLAPVSKQMEARIGKNLIDQVSAAVVR